MRTRLLLPLLVVGLVAAACAAGGGSSPTPSSPAAPASLDGRTFLATNVEGQDLVKDSEVRLVFEAGRVSGSAGCNQFGGDYRIEDGRLVTGAMMMTEMACDEPLMAQEAWVTQLLSARPLVTLEGDTLTLTGEAVTLTLTDREVADPDRPLEGTRWIVDGLVANEAVSSVPAGVTAALRFADGRVEVEAGCNTGGGAIEIAGDVITFGPIGTTKMGCAEPAASVEAHVLSVLTGKVGYEIEADVLRLGGGNGPGLVLRAAEGS